MSEAAMQDKGSDFQDVLDFWFGAPDSAEYGTQRKAWFVKNADFDNQIRTRFLGLHVRAHAGELAHWESRPESLLALIIVLDQFSRNMFRERQQAFASDAGALACARLMVARDWDRRLLPVQRGFVYLPYEHAEDLAMQDEALRLFERVLEDPALADLPEWARKHREVILRFGRFPHRNQILGRASTEEELAFLRQPGSRF